jgi:predicted CXXCH cytochrome family protein
MRWTLAAIICFGFAAPAVHAQQNAECLACHGDNIDEAKQKASVHGILGCTDCHTSIKGYPHPERPQAVNCSACHNGEAKDLVESVHAKASGQPCLSCHGDPHTILPVKDLQSPVFPLNIPRTCGSCHGKPELAKKLGLREVYSLYMDSVHGFALTKDGLLVAATCSSCHGTHKILSHANPHSRTYRTNVPTTCGSCHKGPETQYFAGIHGKTLQAGDARAPVCVDCHTAHQISNPRLVSWQTKTTATCGNCHKERLATYHDTFHAQVSALGYVETAHCWDCHREHEILPASDPKSSVAAANLAITCGRCHAGAATRVLSYQPHADAHDRKKFPAVYYTRVFMNLLLLSVLGFFALHTILWFIRAVFDRPKPGAPTESGASSRQ